jgi:SAM-dependent methyltransferase
MSYENIRKVNSKLLLYYMKMLNDKWRNQFFYDALMSVAKDKVVIDVGCGNGILSAYALAAGAKFVYAIDERADAAHMTEYVLGRHFDKSKFKVITCNFHDAILQNEIEKNSVDILVSETVTELLFDDGMSKTWHIAKRYLKEDAISIPDNLHCDLYVWNNDNNKTFDFPHIYKYMLDKERLLLENFADSLLDYDKFLTPSDIRMKYLDEKERPLRESEKYPLVLQNIKIDYPPPDNIITDVLSVTYENNKLPKFDFVVENSPTTVAIINKISFRDSTIYLQDAKYMPWKYSPVTTFFEEGTYTIKCTPYVNPTQFVWKINKK